MDVADLVVGRWYTIAAMGPMRLTQLPDPEPTEPWTGPWWEKPRRKTTITFQQLGGTNYYADASYVVCELDAAALHRWADEHDRQGFPQEAQALRLAAEQKGA